LSVVVRRARDQAEVDAALELRRRVFCEEQGVTPAADRDGRDGEALHLVALQAGVVVGTCRLLMDGHVGRLGRMAVERELRGRGIGARLLEATERAALRAGARRVTLHAQSAAESLYVRGGYEPRGRRFFEEGIEHVRMEKCLSSA
jgi:predicted GNAT family N-acyltransferase